MLRVFSVDFDFAYRSLAPVGLVKTIEYFNFECTPRAAGWDPPPVYVPNKRDKAADFCGSGPMGLIMRAAATQVLRPLLEEAGELLPIHLGAEIYHTLNVLNCVDCLDTERSVTDPYVQTFVFDPTRLMATKASLFKIKPDQWVRILYVEGLFAPERDFRAAVEAHGLVGLEFRLLWSAE